MKQKVILLGLSLLLVAAMLLASCGTKSTTTTSTTKPTTSTPTTKPITTTPPTSTPPPTSVPPTGSGKWWEKLGTPQYGGELNLRRNKNIINWDPLFGTNNPGICGIYMEQPTATNWLIEPSVFNFQIGWLPPDYTGGALASSWEFTDPATYVLHIRQGIKYQNIAPANGRELTAADIVYHYHRLYGGGDGFTAISTYWASVVQWKDLISVTATDKYTVVFKWKTPNGVAICGALQSPTIGNSIESPEAVKQWGDLSDWRHGIGTGPFILTDFVSDSSVTFIKNPDYWGYDERYPQNKLPYIDKVNVLIITDNTTALAAVRTGKLDVLDAVSNTNAQNVKKSNPEITQLGILLGTVFTVDPRNDVKPFNDIKVRIAMQKAINIPEIAATYYAGAAATLPGTLSSSDMTGFTYPYSEWPQSLKDEYSYDPPAAKKLLADAGYPTGFKTNMVISNDADLALFQIVQAYFAAVGITMEIRPLDPAAWNAFVLSSRQHDQIAARNQGMIGLNYEPIVQINRFLTNYRVNYTMVSDPAYDAFVTKAIATTNMDEFKKVIYDMNKYVAEKHYVISVCQPKLFILSQPWLKGFNGQSNSLFGEMMFCFQFGARFWIDQKVKTTFGR